jgi:radical SAM superfamily enzyme YgiQ (UPF0313 family)/glycosyltransferase involved in cell wall biosynthesis
MPLENSFFESFTQKDIEIFFAVYQKTINLGQTDARSKAYCYYHLGNLFEKYGLIYWAINSYKRAIQANPSDISCHFALANLYRKYWLHYSVIKVYAEMSRIFPENADIQSELQSLQQRLPHKTVTFYLPCYNVEKYIKQAIEGVLEQSYDIDEFLIIDDGSQDNSVNIACQYPVRIIDHPKNMGLGAVRNTAIENAKGVFLASIDTDAVPDPYWLERLMLTFSEDTVAGVGGKLIEQHTVTAVDRWRQVKMKQHHGDNVAENVNLYGSNTVFLLQALKKIGGYNDNLRTNYEDIDLSIRLRSAGYKTVYNPEAICRHLRIDDVISAVDTLYNWRKPFFEFNGAYEKLDELKAKSVNDLKANIRDINKLIGAHHFETLYPNFLSGIRTCFKDMYHFYQNSPDFSNWNSFLAGYIYLIYLLNKSSHKRAELRNYVLEDLSDLALKVTLAKDPGDLSVLNRKIITALESDNDINALLSSLKVNSKTNVGYLSEIFKELSALFNLNPNLWAMIYTSAKRTRYEARNSPYGCKTRVMLLNPPWYAKNRRGVRAGSRWPFTGKNHQKRQFVRYTPYPFFLGYLSSILKVRNITNVIVDGVAEELTNTEFIERVAGYAPDVIVMEIATASYVIDNLWLLRIKERLPNVKVIWVGAHATTLGEAIIKENPFVDFIIQGEYESATAELIQRLIHQTSYDDLKGLLYRKSDGQIINNGKTDRIANIDDLPWPERLTVPIYKYNDLFAGMKYPSLQIHASRGCPFGCIYCVWPQVLYGGKNYRPRQPEKVIEEVETIVDEFGFQSVYFDDDTFNIGKKRMRKICDEMVQRKINVSWGAMARADTADYETLKAMKAAGLVGIKFGVESGVQELVDNAEKALDLKKVRKAVDWCKSLGIKTHLTFTFGLPGETRDTIRQTIEFAKELNPDSIQFSITTPFPGTKYFEILKQNGCLLTQEWEMYDGTLYTVIKTDDLSSHDLEDAVKQANSEFNQFKQRVACS